MSLDSIHQPVLLHETIAQLSPQPKEVVLDATLGGGGHSLAICKAASEITLIGLDVDRQALAKARHRLEQGCQPKELHLVRSSFKDLDLVLDELRLPSVDKALFDLGFSSDQLTAGRGLSFTTDEPLIMTLDDQPDEEDLTAYEIVNSWEADSLLSIISGYGEERYAKGITQAIIEARPIKSTQELAEVIKHSVPRHYRHRKIHPATKTFQALRITVNNELENLKTALRKTIERLNPGGRVAVISFHSLEDRIVKRQFVDWEKRDLGSRLSKKPITATTAETKNNPRARSAKLRIFEKKS